MNEKKVILVVDDTPANIEILIELLSDEYDVMAAIDGQSAIESAVDDKPDLILLDIIMPDMNGYEVCEKLKNIEITKNIPIIFITALKEEDSIAKAYDIGGVDYVTKPFMPKELLARVRTQIELRSLINHLEFISSHDTMTGVFNRRKFFEIATRLFKEQNESLFAVMIDIDKFKAINDKYGHHCGDEVIKAVASTINELLPKDTFFGRVGGEEFAMIGNSHTKQSINNALELIRTTISQLEIVTTNNETIKFTISSGFTFYNQNKDLDDLLKEADTALYQAKNEGRNKTIFR